MITFGVASVWSASTMFDRMLEDAARFQLEVPIARDAVEVRFDLPPFFAKLSQQNFAKLSQQNGPRAGSSSGGSLCA
jgi:hypothetical protein